MTSAGHLNNDLLVRAVDDELSPPEALLVDSHLPVCEICRQSYQRLRSLSVHIESAVAAHVPAEFGGDREILARALQARESKTAARRAPRVFWQFGWGVALAAALAFGILVSPEWTHRARLGSTDGQVAQAGSAYEVDGETFVALPYSNPDLPLTSPHIVQMQVPVSWLADAGIVFEPVSNEVAVSDRSVLADVLLGIDGQPLGVHVLSVE